jgi:Flp pilus assembly protein TadD
MSDTAIRAAAQLFGAGRYEEAWNACQAILASDPRHFYALHLGSATALKLGRFDACIALATRALAVTPGHPEVLANRGAALRRTNRIDEALADYDTVLASGTGTPTLLVNRGIALAALNRHAEAIAQYDHALAIDPRHAPAHFHRGLSRLVTGDLAGGFADNEWRWAGSETQGPPRELPGMRWTGAEDLNGATLLLYAEQGLGDTIQMARYATLAKQRGARVILEVPPPLKRLLASVPGVDGIAGTGQPLPPFDFHCALMSAPHAFGTTLESIPHLHRYVSVEAAAIAHWKLGTPHRRVGFAWSGSRTLVNDINRSIPLTVMQPLFERVASPVSLQKDVRDEDGAALARAKLAQAGHALNNFADTAALIEHLDLVVTVDTSVAHLAGAMGKTAWILLPFAPDWRWLLDRVDSPWYPTARLFRQTRIGDWESVIDDVADALAELK